MRNMFETHTKILLKLSIKKPLVYVNRAEITSIINFVAVSLSCLHILKNDNKANSLTLFIMCISFRQNFILLILLESIIALEIVSIGNIFPNMHK